MKNNLKEKKYDSDIIYHLNELENQLLNAQTEFSRNESVYRYYNYHLEKTNLLKRLSLKTPRFAWLQIQEEIDRLYSVDSTLTGCQIIFDFKEAITPNRALIKCNVINL